MMKRDELFANVVMIVFFGLMLIKSMELRFVRRFAEMGSGFWPILILSSATLLSIILLISNFRKYIQQKKTAAGEEEVSPEAMRDSKERKKKFALSVICLLLYVISMPFIGFVLSTFLYVLAFILALGERRKLVLAFSPILVTALTVIIFAKFIAIPLPKGVNLFAAFSRIFY